MDKEFYMTTIHLTDENTNIAYEIPFKASIWWDCFWTEVEANRVVHKYFEKLNITPKYTSYSYVRSPSRVY